MSNYFKLNTLNIILILQTKETKKNEELSNMLKHNWKESEPGLKPKQSGSRPLAPILICIKGETLWFFLR